MKVRVKKNKTGFYDKLRKSGDIFDIRDEKDFSNSWMEKAETTPTVTVGVEFDDKGNVIEGKNKGGRPRKDY